MSTVNRHTLKRANQSRRKRSPELPEKKPQAPLRSTVRAAKRLGKNRWLWVVVVLLAVSIGLGSWYYTTRGTAPLSAHNSQQTAAHAASTLVPTAPPNWKTVQTFNGNSTGNATQKLQMFTVSGNWQITWACQGVNGVDDWLYIAIYNPNGSLYNAGAQVTCIAAKQVIGNAQESKSGQFYLTVDANTSWTIQVQVPT